jgi:transposase
MGIELGYVLGDRAYDGSPIREVIVSRGAEAVIPPHPRRKDPAHYDRHLYKARQTIENLFTKLE